VVVVLLMGGSRWGVRVGATAGFRQ